MATIFGYITTAQLSGTDDPVEVLRSAITKDALLLIGGFSPDATSTWARAGVTRVGPTRTITNQETGSGVEVAVCTLS